MRAAWFTLSAVAGYVAGASAALFAAQTFFNAPPLYNRSDLNGTFLTSGGTILAVDPVNDTVTVDMASPYSIYEHAPFRLTYSDKTSILIGNGILGTGYVTRPGTVSDLAVGMKVQVRIPREPGPLSADFIKSL